jgi:chromosome segregation ATPase
MIDRKLIVIIGLIVIIAAGAVFTFGKVNQVSLLQRDKTGLEEEKKTINDKLESMIKENRAFKEKITAFDERMEKLGTDKNEIQKRLEGAVKEKEDLKNEVKKLNKDIAAEKGRSEIIKSAPRSSEEATEAGSAGPEKDNYWAGILKNKAELELEVETLRDDLDALKETNEKLMQAKNGLSLELKSQSRGTRDSERQLMYNNKVIDSLTQELFREKSDKLIIQANLNSLEADNALLKDQLKNLDTRKVELENKFAELQAKNKVMENNLTRMELFIRQKVMQMDNLKAELGSLQQPKIISFESEESARPAALSRKEAGEPRKEAVQLQPIVVRPQDTGKGKTAPAVVQANKAEVMAINAENNFVIINVGENSGIKVGDRFRIHNKKRETISDVEVIQVRKNIAACDIKTQNYYIEVGDEVK